MKKSYEAPRLNSHGRVNKLTAASGQLGFNDFFFAEKGEPTQMNGSLNVCVTKPGTGVCVNPKSTDPKYTPTKK
ncbi:hypothetical protein NIES4071_28820 [Calothrix sp. NIES-4071]|nr:hypothetical protein NIES4071_28820 [Calothrix sp. NIES-4071]BAZ57203.1 hypothetical protein NIES4105_28760 [Calothrix sp. NIES-4105]